MTVLRPDDRAALADLAPALRHAVTLDPGSIARVRLGGGSATVLVRLPFDVLVARTVAADRSEPLDLTATGADLLRWLDAQPEDAAEPQRRDTEWRTSLPPTTGWRRIETVPDTVIRDLVRTGGIALKDAAARAGVPGAQPRAEVADALLDTVVLTATDDSGARAEITLRAMSALTRMGFLPRGGYAYIDAAGRWIRLVAEYGTVYLEQPGQELRLG